MKVVNYQKYRESVRQSLVDAELQNEEKLQTIILSSGEKVILGSIGHSHDGSGRYFLVEPKYEGFYVAEIQQDNNLWGFYNKWIRIRTYEELDQTELLNFVISCHDILKKRTGYIKQSVVFFLLDVFYEHLNGIVSLADIYYPYYLKNYPKENKKLSHILNALNQTILSIPWDQLKNSSYGLEGCIQELFKELYFIQLFGNGVFGVPIIKGDDVSFKENFEKRWQTLEFTQNLSYCFDVVPFINPQDYFKYLELSLVKVENEKELNVSYEIMDYVTYGIFSKNYFHLDTQYREYLIENLIKFVYSRYVDPYLRKLKKNLKIAMDESSRMEIVDQIGKIIREYDPFFFSFRSKSLRHKKELKHSLFGPVGRNQNLFLTGALYEHNGFHFIPYLQAKIRTLDMNYLEPKERKENGILSLDQSLSDDPDGGIFIDFFVSEEDQKKYNLCSSVVAANSYVYRQDQEFYINEFAKIIGVAPITLRRWDKDGWLIPYRRTRGNKGLRCYSKDQINLALKIKVKKERRQRHKIG